MTEPRRFLDAPDPAWPEGFTDALSSYSSTGPDLATRARMLARLEAASYPPPPTAAGRPSWLAPALVGLLLAGVATVWFGRADRSPAATIPARAPAVAVPPPPPWAAEPALQVGPNTSAPPKTEAEPSAVPPARSARARVAKPAPTADEPAAELELLIRARRVVSVAPGEALALADKHAAHYPRGTFAEEREVLAIEAERRLGRREAAAARVRRFVQAYPGSIHRAQLEGDR